MTIKGVIQPDHVQVNKYLLQVTGLPELVLTAITGIEEELQVTDLPDGTKGSGGRTLPVEYDITIPAHHLSQLRAIEQWFQDSKDPVKPDHQKLATLTLFTQSNNPLISFTLPETFPTKRATPDLELENEGEMAGITWSMSSKEVLPNYL